MEAIEQYMTASGTTEDLSLWRGASEFLGGHLPAYNPLLPCMYSPSFTLHLGRSWGQVRSGGAFPRPIFQLPLELPESQKPARHRMPAPPASTPLPTSS